MGKTVKEYEWENRLGTISYQLNSQGRSLRGYKEMFEDKIEPLQHEFIDKIANSAEQLGTMVRELEDEIHDGSKK
jgi:signal transduction histidine kinase